MWFFLLLYNTSNFFSCSFMDTNDCVWLPSIWTDPCPCVGNVPYHGANLTSPKQSFNPDSDIPCLPRHQGMVLDCGLGSHRASKDMNESQGACLLGWNWRSCLHGCSLNWFSHSQVLLVNHPISLCIPQAELKFIPKVDKRVSIWKLF